MMSEAGCVQPENLPWAAEICIYLCLSVCLSLSVYIYIYLLRRRGGMKILRVPSFLLK